jgi:predicted peroxiredoxin
MQRTALVFLGILVGAFIAAPAARTHDVPPGATHGDPRTDPALKPLFINMTSGDSWRGWMGLHFAHSTLKMGHPVAIFLNLDAVKLAATNLEQEMKPSMKRLPREILNDFITDGGIVLMCGPCMSEYGLTIADLVPGVRMGAPGVTQGYIFAENARTLTW